MKKCYSNWFWFLRIRSKSFTFLKKVSGDRTGSPRVLVFHRQTVLLRFVNFREILNLLTACWAAVLFAFILDLISCSLFLPFLQDSVNVYFVIVITQWHCLRRNSLNNWQQMRWTILFTAVTCIRYSQHKGWRNNMW